MIYQIRIAALGPFNAYFPSIANKTLRLIRASCVYTPHSTKQCLFGLVIDQIADVMNEPDGNGTLYLSDSLNASFNNVAFKFTLNGNGLISGALQEISDPAHLQTFEGCIVIFSDSDND